MIDFVRQLVFKNMSLFCAQVLHKFGNNVCGMLTSILCVFNHMESVDWGAYFNFLKGSYILVQNFGKQNIGKMIEIHIWVVLEIFLYFFVYFLKIHFIVCVNFIFCVSVDCRGICSRDNLLSMQTRFKTFVFRDMFQPYTRNLLYFGGIFFCNINVICA